MVSYQTWTSVAFEVARQKGAEFETMEQSAEFVRDVVSPLWSEHGEELSTATKNEARTLARRRIEA